MKLKALFVFLGLAFFGLLRGAENPAPVASPTDEARAVLARIQAKMGAGERSAAALAPEIAAFEAVLAKYREQKTEEMAQLHYIYSALHGQLLGNLEKGKALLAQLQRDFPNTRTAVEAAQTIAALEKAAKTQEVRDQLVGKAAPELNFTWSTRDGLKKLSDLKGKVVVLDFWATWCGPCVASFPEVRELAAHYKDMDVVVVGVTSLQGRVSGLQAVPIDTRDNPQRELALMNDFIKAKGITWTIAFSEQEVFNSDYGIEGIPHMAIVAPDGTVRFNGLHPAEPLAEKTARIDALLKEFGKPVLASSPNK